MTKLNKASDRAAQSAKGKNMLDKHEQTKRRVKRVNDRIQMIMNDTGMAERAEIKSHGKTIAEISHLIKCSSAGAELRGSKGELVKIGRFTHRAKVNGVDAGLVTAIKFRPTDQNNVERRLAELVAAPTEAMPIVYARIDGFLWRIIRVSKVEIPPVYVVSLDGGKVVLDHEIEKIVIQPTEGKGAKSPIVMKGYIHPPKGNQGKKVTAGTMPRYSITADKLVANEVSWSQVIGENKINYKEPMDSADNKITGCVSFDKVADDIHLDLSQGAFLANEIPDDQKGLDPKTSEKGLRYNKGKLRLDLIPPEMLEGVADVLGYGAAKYADRNWEKGMSWMDVIASLKRHCLAFEKGEEIDGEGMTEEEQKLAGKSGLPHVDHIATNAAFLQTFFKRNIGTDDRPIIKKS